MSDACSAPAFVFVTAVYNIRRGAYERTLWDRCTLLAEACPPCALIYVWCDHGAEPPAAITALPSVCILRAALDEFPSFVAGMTPGLQLPACRNADKDTAAFMALINAKVDMVARAACSDRHAKSYAGSPLPPFAWIDAGIIKLWDQRVEELRVNLSAVVRARVPDAAFIVPGIWPRMLTLDGACDNKVCWRFCGGFFAIAGDSVQMICAAIQDRYASLVKTGRTSWEVNVWALLEAEMHATAVCAKETAGAAGATTPLPLQFNVVWLKSEHDATFFSAF